VTGPVATDPQREACVRLLTWLADEGNARRAGSQSSDVIATQSDMAVLYPRISDAALPGLLNVGQATVDLRPHGWIYGPETSLRVASPELVPAVTVRWEWTRAAPSIHIMVVLLIAGTTSTAGLDATAFRFESGHRGRTHNYDHVQPTLRVSLSRSAALPGTRTPLNESLPAFPLDSIGPVGVTMCVLLSLYGQEVISRMLSGDRSLRATIVPYIGELPAFSRAMQPHAAAGSVLGTSAQPSGPLVPRQGPLRPGSIPRPAPPPGRRGANPTQPSTGGRP
jgi:hypothetical protein